MRRSSAATPCFNPHPARGPGAAAPTSMSASSASVFQSSPGPGAGCCRRLERPPRAHTARFNPHPARGPGAAGEQRGVVRARQPFQSSPGPGAGCCRNRVSVTATLPSVFQSSPGPGAGCCRGRACRRGRPRSVSILTRPGGRVLPHPSRSSAASRHGFNPHPARGPGAAGHDVLFLVDLHERFQSSPGPGAGCCRLANLQPRPHRLARAVSILTRPGGRVLLPRSASMHSARPVSILTRPGGRVLQGHDRLPYRRGSEFQSSPGPGAGCCVSPLGITVSEYLVFQSSPGPGAGCCCEQHGPDGDRPQVSILTRPGDRVLPASPPAPSPGRVVSILTRPGGRVLPNTQLVT